MTRLLRTMLASGALLMSLFAPSLAQAATVEACQSSIAALTVQAADVTFHSRQAEKEEAGLIAKLGAASEALGSGKNADAIRKLTDVQLHVSKLAADGKLDPSDGATLVQGATDAITCITSIGA